MKDTCPIFLLPENISIFRQNGPIHVFSFGSHGLPGPFEEHSLHFTASVVIDSISFVKGPINIQCPTKLASLCID